MKPPSTSTAALGLLLALTGVAVGGRAQESTPERRPTERQPAERPSPERAIRPQRIEARAQELRAQGRPAEAEEWRRNLPPEREAQTQRPEREVRPLPGRPAPAEALLRQWTARWERALNELREQHAIQLKEAVRHLEGQLERFAERTRPRAGAAAPRAEFDRERGPTPERVDAQRRVEHLTVAIEHLHAAGMKDAAERLGREREEMTRRLEGESDRPAPWAELRRLRAEVEELRQALGRLQAHVEELHRDRR
jgi:ElaB/YqjD/DUF883 family membrane-anchored ribosome-binding protein